MRLSTGYILNNRYRIVRLLGQGGFGAVYRAWDLNLSLPCALKENTETSPEAARQFLREAQLLHTLRHPNLPLVKDHFVVPDQGQYLVMDFIEGQDLQEIIEAGGINISQAVSWVLQICDALAYLHSQNPAVIHRDIKPANIKITPEGRAMLVDFGIAKVFDAKSRTTAGARAVTAGYSPFEQYGSAPTDARTDVYALGATLYALLTREEPVESISRVAGTELTSPRSLNPEISPDLDEVLLKAMAIMSAERYQSTLEFKEAIVEAIGDVPEPARPVSATLQRQPSVEIGTAVVEDDTVARRPPSEPPLAKPPSTPRPASKATTAEGKKPLPWKWIIIGAAVVLLLVCAPLGYLGVRQLLKPNEPTSTARPTNTSRSSAATSTPRPTAPPVVEPNEGDCIHPEVLCVGLVTDIYGLMDGAFNQAAWEGVQRIQEELGAIVNFIETRNEEDYFISITEFAEAGYDVIVTVSFMLSDATLQAASQYPEVYFIGADQYQNETLPNLAGLVFHDDHMGFLAGVLAANLSRSGLIAGVYGSNLISPIVAISEGYERGAAYLNPDISVVMTYHPGSLDTAFVDPDWGAAVAAEDIAAGVDVIFGAGGVTPNGAFTEAAYNPEVYCIGVDFDQWERVPEGRPCLVTSIIKRIDQGVFDLIVEYQQGNRPSGNQYGHLSLAPFRDLSYLIPPDLENYLNDINAQLEDGTLETGYSGSNEPETEPVTITIWSMWSGTYLEAIEAVFESYSRYHPNVTIRIEEPENLIDVASVAIPAGEGPDIIAWGNDVIGILAENGLIANLTDLGVTHDELVNTYEPAAVNGVIWQDAIWALPESQEGIALVFNTTLANDADFPEDPMNFEELLQRAASYYNRTGRYLICNQGLGNVDAYHSAPVWFGYGVPSYVDDQGSAYLDTPEAFAAANWMLEYRAFAPQETSHEICMEMLMSGQSAAWWTGPWALADLESAGINYGIRPMGRPFVGIKSLMITTNAMDRGAAETALDVIRYFTNAESSTHLALTNNTIPANTEALHNPDVQSLESVAGFGAAMNLGIPMANTPFASAQWGPVGEATFAIWTSAQTPAQALSAAQSEIEAIIAEMR